MSPITTAWTIICEAQHLSDSEPVRRKCIEFLMETYHEPVRAMIRAWGVHDEHRVDDCLQEYFTVFLEKNWLDQLDRNRGSFRGFLRVSIRNFLLRQKERENRIPALRPLAEEQTTWIHDAAVVATQETAEDTFNRMWAVNLVQTALQKFSKVCRERELQHYLQVFERHVTDVCPDADPSIRETAASMGLTEKDVTNYLYRSKQMFASIVHDLIRETVGHDSGIEEELRDLRRYFP